MSVLRHASAGFSNTTECCSRIVLCDSYLATMFLSVVSSMKTVGLCTMMEGLNKDTAFAVLDLKIMRSNCNNSPKDQNILCLSYKGTTWPV